MNISNLLHPVFLATIATEVHTFEPVVNGELTGVDDKLVSQKGYFIYRMPGYLFDKKGHPIVIHISADNQYIVTFVDINEDTAEVTVSHKTIATKAGALVAAMLHTFHPADFNNSKDWEAFFSPSGAQS